MLPFSPSATKVLKSFYRSSLTLPYISLLSCPITSSPILKTTFARSCFLLKIQTSFLFFCYWWTSWRSGPFSGTHVFYSLISMCFGFPCTTPWGILAQKSLGSSQPLSWLASLWANPYPFPSSFSVEQHLPPTCLYVLSQYPLSTSMPSTFT